MPEQCGVLHQDISGLGGLVVGIFVVGYVCLGFGLSGVGLSWGLFVVE